MLSVVAPLSHNSEVVKSVDIYGLLSNLQVKWKLNVKTKIDFLWFKVFFYRITEKARFFVRPEIV